jgi:tight adherence protein C
MGYTLAISFFVLFAVILSAGGYYYYIRPVRFIRAAAFEPRTDGSSPQLLDRLKAAVRRQFVRRVAGLTPALPSDKATLRRDLYMAGFRDSLAVTVYSGARMLMVAVCLAAGWFLHTMVANPAAAVAFPATGIGLGLFAPGIVLDRLIKRRQDRIQCALPDALDLLVVCCEVGCGLDQAIQTVAREFRTVHPDLSDELAFINMEILAGSSRSVALRNFGTRTGMESVRKMSAILIQTDRFGTSIADALRSQADFMRVRRRQEAEERAGKVGVKLVFPIFFFCMPALMVFVAGPGIIEMFRMLGQVVGSPGAGQ